MHNRKRQFFRCLLGSMMIMLLMSNLCQALTIDQYFRIDPQASFVAYETWLHFGGEYEDTVPRPIAGGFRMVVDDAMGYPNLRFENVKVSTPQLPYGNFDFPNYFARYDGPDLSGTEDICRWFIGSGLCDAMGNVGSFTGSFDGTNLTMSGVDPITEFSSYLYTIHATAAPDPATAVPEPATLAMLGIGLAFIGWRGYRCKTR